MLENSTAKKKRFSKESLRASIGVFAYLKPYWFIFSIGMLLLFLSAVLVLSITALLGLLMVPDTEVGVMGGPFTAQIIESVKAFASYGSTGITLAALVALLIIQGVFSFFRVYIFSYVTENAMLAIRRDAFSTIIRMPMQYYNENRVGDVGSRLSSDITTIQETLQWTLAEFIRQIIIIFAGIVGLIAFSDKLTLVMLGTLPVMIIVMVFFGKFIRKLSKITQDKVAESGVIVNESLTGIVNVKSFANEAYEAGRFTNAANEIKKLAMKGARWRGVFGTFIIIFLFGALGIVIGTGAHLVSTGELGKEVLPQFIMVTGLVAGSIGGLAAQMGALQRSLGAIDNVMEILKYKTEDVQLDKRSSELRVQGDISFNNVRFHYASRTEIEVLKGVSFEVKSGQTIALVGSSGSGKSTIASLIQRFYEPVSGDILLDGKRTSEYDLTDLRSQMAFVPQEVILFGGTIRENIAYGKIGASEEEIIEAAKKANAFDFIQSFPEKLDTIVGDRGIQLSGGQRQRIAIARAVLRNPRILILDEATSSLDSESEKQVQAALDELMKNRTSIVIAHRLSTIRNADKIVVLDVGVVRESGTHHDLIQIPGGFYKRLSDLQFEEENEIAS